MAARSRCIAIVGPQQSGKTCLLEALLHRAGAIEQVGRGPTRVGDARPEARAHGMSVELNVAGAEFLGDHFTFLDCPGSLEFACEMRAALPVCDAAIVVCEADEKKLPALELVLREVEEAGLPHLIFINKIDATLPDLRQTLALLQGVSRTPLLLRQIPIEQGGTAIGFIDLALERAFIYQRGAPSRTVEIPADAMSDEKDSRYSMLERLADHDDALMEELISEIEPSPDRVFGDLAGELRAGQVVSVLMGSAERAHGVRRLLKALRHEAPRLDDTRRRLGLAETGPALAQVFKTQHTGFGGKLSLARILRGTFAEGATITGSGGASARIAGVSRLFGGSSTRLSEAPEGDVAGFAKLEGIATGETIAIGARPEPVPMRLTQDPVYATAIRVRDRKDDVRLSSALAKILEEDPSLILEHRPDLGEMHLRGQGDMHLRVARERLESRYQVHVETGRPRIGYRETIRGPSAARGRHKKQTGGHGQFGDVAIEVRPLSRGEGFAFEDKVTGGAVPRQYIGSVEAGARDYLKRGPLGFPIVDLAVTLTDGSYHSVDSSDAAFQAAVKLALGDALPKSKPVLLEPILAVDIHTPAGATAKATALVTTRRGQILGFEARDGWPGWDVVHAQIPEAEIEDLIIELRSLTAGVGSFTARFDHMAELTGRSAEIAVATAIAT